MADNQVSIPQGFGGILRYSEEYESKIMLKPSHVIIFTILIILFVTVLRFIY